MTGRLTGATRRHRDPKSDSTDQLGLSTAHSFNWVAQPKLMLNVSLTDDCGVHSPPTSKYVCRLASETDTFPIDSLENAMLKIFPSPVAQTLLLMCVCCGSSKMIGWTRPSNQS